MKMVFEGRKDKEHEENYCFANHMSSSLIYLKIITNLKIIKVFKLFDIEIAQSKCDFNK